jgi:hypothetical protein
MPGVVAGRSGSRRSRGGNGFLAFVALPAGLENPNKKRDHYKGNQQFRKTD